MCTFSISGVHFLRPPVSIVRRGVYRFPRVRVAYDGIGENPAWTRQEQLGWQSVS